MAESVAGTPRGDQQSVAGSHATRLELGDLTDSETSATFDDDESVAPSKAGTPRRDAKRQGGLKPAKPALTNRPRTLTKLEWKLQEARKSFSDRAGGARAVAWPKTRGRTSPHLKLSLSILPTSTQHLEKDKTLFYSPIGPGSGTAAHEFAGTLREGLLVYFSPLKTHTTLQQWDQLDQRLQDQIQETQVKPTPFQPPAPGDGDVVSQRVCELADQLGVHPNHLWQLLEQDMDTVSVAASSFTEKGGLSPRRSPSHVVAVLRAAAEAHASQAVRPATPSEGLTLHTDQSRKQMEARISRALRTATHTYHALSGSPLTTARLGDPDNPIPPIQAAPVEGDLRDAVTQRLGDVLALQDGDGEGGRASPQGLGAAHSRSSTSPLPDHTPGSDPAQPSATQHLLPPSTRASPLLSYANDRSSPELSPRSTVLKWTGVTLGAQDRALEQILKEAARRRATEPSDAFQRPASSHAPDHVEQEAHEDDEAPANPLEAQDHSSMTVRPQLAGITLSPRDPNVEATVTARHPILRDSTHAMPPTGAQPARGAQPANRPPPTPPIDVASLRKSLGRSLAWRHAQKLPGAAAYEGGGDDSQRRPRSVDDVPGGQRADSLPARQQGQPSWAHSQYSFSALGAGPHQHSQVAGVGSGDQDRQAPPAGTSLPLADMHLRLMQQDVLGGQPRPGSGDSGGGGKTGLLRKRAPLLMLQRQAGAGALELESDTLAASRAVINYKQDARQVDHMLWMAERTLVPKKLKQRTQQANVPLEV